MSILDEAKRPEIGPFIGTIAGEPGLGKTSLGCLFPEPFVLCYEHGLERVEESIRPKGLEITTLEQSREVLRALLNEEHDFKTIVVDTATAVENMFVQYVIDNDDSNPQSINTAVGGWGNGTKAVAQMHANFTAALRKISVKRNMNIVYIVHSDIVNVDLPDKDPYMRYSFRMGKHSVQYYVDEVNLVGFLSREIFLSGGSKPDSKIQKPKKARTNGDIILDCVPRASSIAKNGYQIDDLLTFYPGVNPLADYLPTAK